MPRLPADSQCCMLSESAVTACILVLNYCMMRCVGVLSAVVAGDHSFTRATFFLGVQPWKVANVLANAPISRSSDSIEINNFAVSGFSKQGDRLCWPLTVSQV